MSVLLSTTLGDIVIDLFTQECPIACTNFLKLCKLKYYNNVLFFNVQENFMIQTGDPTGTGKGGDSMYGQLYGAQAHFFQDEFHSNLKHNRKGTVRFTSSVIYNLMCSTTIRLQWPTPDPTPTHLNST